MKVEDSWEFPKTNTSSEFYTLKLIKAQVSNSICWNIKFGPFPLNKGLVASKV